MSHMCLIFSFFFSINSSTTQISLPFLNWKQWFIQLFHACPITKIKISDLSQYEGEWTPWDYITDPSQRQWTEWIFNLPQDLVVRNSWISSFSFDLSFIQSFEYHALETISNSILPRILYLIKSYSEKFIKIWTYSDITVEKTWWSELD